jgi:hypothetical protein
MRALLRLGLTGLVLSLIVGCSAAGTTPSPEPSAIPSASLALASDQPTLAPGGTSAPAPTIDLPAAVIEAVKAEIAADAGVAARDVTIISAQAVTFPDGSLGCPSPGVNYIQVQVDGFIVVGTAAGATFDYRGTSPTDIRRCEKPR